MQIHFASKSCVDSVTARHSSSGRRCGGMVQGTELQNFRSSSFSTEGATYIPRAVITLGIGPHSSSLYCPFPSFSRPPFHSACLPPFFHVPRFLHYASFRTRTDLLKAPITKGVVIFKLSGGFQNVWGFCFLTYKGHWISPVFGRR